MSQKVFDILPPYPKDEPRTYHRSATKNKKEKIKSQHNFLIFMFGLFFILVLFSLFKLENFNGSFLNQKTAPTQTNDTNADTKTNQFELFDDRGQSNLAASQQQTSVRLLNGATKASSVSTAKDLLLKNNYVIEKQDKASNTYGQTIIYYKKGKIALGQQVNEVLKSNFSPLLQESSGLDAGYDILVIVGDK